ncbi:MAG: amidohydrolase [Ruminococcaceae bacterium]|nr:amidohydrolase [Oscillospiraceae bacterium]
MIIDFHTHAFPDSLAPRAIAGLVESAGGKYPPCHNGTVDGLKANMQSFGVDISVVQPVITKHKQTESLNKWAESINEGNIISFGGIYPHSDDPKGDIDFVCSLGLKGLKFHPEYQDFTVDTPEMLKIYDYALSKGLILLFHAGFDIAYQPPFRSGPKAFRHIMDELGGGTIVAAHMGGAYEWEQTEELLAGTGIYLDTSMGFDEYGDEQFMRLVKAIGSSNILFGSDAPWSNAGEEIKRIQALPLTETEKNDILGDNAKRILGI